jgi:hypothetical protein
MALVDRYTLLRQMGYYGDQATMEASYAKDTSGLDTVGEQLAKALDVQMALNVLGISNSINQVFNVKDYGAVGNGVTSDTVAFQSAIDAAHAVTGGTELFVPSGTFMVNDLVTYGGVTIRGVGESSVLKQTSAGGLWLLSVNPNSGGSSDPATNETGIRIRDLKLMGRSGTFDQQQKLLNLNAVTDVKIERVTFKGWVGDAVYIGSSNVPSTERHNRKVHIVGCDFDGIDNINRNGISIIDGDGVWIERCNFANISRSDMPGAIDAEPNSTTFAIIRDIWIRDNTFTNITGGAGVVGLALKVNSVQTVPSRGFWIEGNTFNISSTSDVIKVSSTETTSDSTIPHNITIRNNKILGGKSALWAQGVRGVSFAGNYVEGSSFSSLLGQGVATVTDISIENNFFRQNVADPAGNGSLLYLSGGSRLSIKGNTFDNNGRSDNTQGYILVLGGGYSSDQVSIQRNRIFGTRTTKAVSVQATHTASPVTNDYTDNQDVSTSSIDATFGAPQDRVSLISAPAPLTLTNSVTNPTPASTTAWSINNANWPITYAANEITSERAAGASGTPLILVSLFALGISGNPITLPAGTTWNRSIEIKPPVDAHVVLANPVGFSAQPTLLLPAGVWTRVTESFTATGAAIYPTALRVNADADPGAGGVFTKLRKAQLVQAPLTQFVPYFDGSTAGAAWTGTANASTSTWTGITVAAPPGYPADGRQARVRVRDSGVASAIVWDPLYRAGSLSLPTITVVGNTIYATFVYNQAATKWDLVSLANAG